MTIALAMLDVDGTLVDETTWHPGARELLDALADAGVVVALCSGREIAAMRRTAADLPMVAYLAGGGGSVVEARDGDDWRLVGRRYLDRAVVDEVCRRTADAGMELWAYTDEGWLVLERTPRVEHDETFTHAHALLGTIEGRDDVTKLLTFTDSPAHDAALEGIVAIGDLAVASSYPGYWDLLPLASLQTKGGDLILADAGLDWADAMAAGDGSNDVGMLSRAGVAYALAPRTLDDLEPATEGQERHAGGVIADVLADLRRRGVVA